MESDPKEVSQTENVNEEEYDEDDYSEQDEENEVIDFNSDEYVVMDVDDFLERAEDQLKLEEEANAAEEEEEPVEEIQRDSFLSFEEHTDSVLMVAFNPSQNSQVLTGGQDDRGFLFDYNHPELKRELQGHKDSVCTIAYNNTGEYCATGDMNGLIQVWKTSTGKLVTTIEGPEEMEWMKFYPKNNVLLASGNDYSIWMWMIPSGKQVGILSGHTDIVTCAAVTPSGKMLVTASLDNTLKLWQLQKKEILYSMKSDENNWHLGGVECIDLFATNSLCVSGGRDGTVKLTNLKTHKILSGYEHTSEDEKENCSVESVSFNPKYNWIASASMNSTVMIYDYQTSIVRHTLKHDGGVIKVKWHPNGVVLVSGCLDGCVYIWNGNTGELLQRLNGHTDLMLDMDVIVKGKKMYISTVGDDHTCQVYRVDV